MGADAAAIKNCNSCYLMLSVVNTFLLIVFRCVDIVVLSRISCELITGACSGNQGQLWSVENLRNLVVGRYALRNKVANEK